MMRRLQPGQMPTAAEWNELVTFLERWENQSSDPSTGIEFVRTGVGPPSMRLPPRPVQVVQADSSVPDPSTPNSLYFDGSVAIYETATGLQTEREKCWIYPVLAMEGAPGPPGPGAWELTGYDSGGTVKNVLNISHVFFGTPQSSTTFPMYIQDLGGGQVNVFSFDATRTQSGIVNTTAQDWNGNKTLFASGSSGATDNVVIEPAAATFTGPGVTLNAVTSAHEARFTSNDPSSNQCFLDAKGVHVLPIASSNTQNAFYTGVSNATPVRITANNGTSSINLDIQWDNVNGWRLDLDPSNIGAVYAIHGVLGISTTFSNGTNTLHFTGGILTSKTTP